MYKLNRKNKRLYPISNKEKRFFSVAIATVFPEFKFSENLDGYTFTFKDKDLFIEASNEQSKNVDEPVFPFATADFTRGQST